MGVFAREARLLRLLARSADAYQGGFDRFVVRRKCVRLEKIDLRRVMQRRHLEDASKLKPGARVFLVNLNSPFQFLFSRPHLPLSHPQFAQEGVHRRRIRGLRERLCAECVGDGQIKILECLSPIIQSVWRLRECDR